MSKRHRTNTNNDRQYLLDRANIFDSSPNNSPNQYGKRGRQHSLKRNSRASTPPPPISPHKLADECDEKKHSRSRPSISHARSSSSTRSSSTRLSIGLKNIHFKTPKSKTKSSAPLSDSSSSHSAPKAPPKQMPCVLKYASINFIALKRKIDFAERNDSELQHLELKLTESSNDASSKQENDSENEQIEKDIKKIKSKIQRNVLGSDFILKYSQNGHNVINEYVGDKKGIDYDKSKISTKRGLKTKDLLTLSLQIMSPLQGLEQLKALKEEGCDHKQWKELVKKVNTMCRNNIICTDERDIILKSSKLIIKTLQRLFDPEHTFKELQNAYKAYYEPMISTNEEIRKYKNYKIMWRDLVSPKIVVTKERWDAVKATLKVKSDEEPIVEPNNDIPPSLSLSIDPIELV